MSCDVSGITSCNAYSIDHDYTNYNNNNPTTHPIAHYSNDNDNKNKNEMSSDTNFILLCMHYSYFCLILLCYYFQMLR